MAKYKPYELTQTKMIPLSYATQIVEGSFEVAAPLHGVKAQRLGVTPWEALVRLDLAPNKAMNADKGLEMLGLSERSPGGGWSPPHLFGIVPCCEPVPIAFAVYRQSVRRT